MEVLIMASRILKNFLEENNLSFETLKITKIDRDTGAEIELDSEAFLYELLNRIRYSNTTPSTKHRMVEKPIKLTDEQCITAIPKKTFELGMMETMSLGIELSSISFTNYNHSVPYIRQLEPNIDFAMLRYGIIQDSRFYKDCDFDKYYKMVRRCRSISVGCYIYIYDLFNFEPKDIKRIIEKAYADRVKFDYPIMFDIDSGLFYDNGTLPDIAMSKISAIVRILNGMDVMFMFANDLKNIITAKYPFEIINSAERFIVPNDILSTLEPLDYITRNKKGNIMTAYNIDDKGIVHCITHKGISDYIKSNHLNGY
jgi:hypothetical protein